MGPPKGATPLTHIVPNPKSVKDENRPRDLSHKHVKGLATGARPIELTLGAKEAHHRVGVDFNATSKANNLYFSTTIASNFIMKVATLVNPSKCGNSHTSVPIQCNDLVILAHLLVETSCNLCCQFSRPSSESDEQELILCQLKFPYVVGLI